MVGLGRACSSVCASLRTVVSSRTASSKVQLSDVSAMISDDLPVGIEELCSVESPETGLKVQRLRAKVKDLFIERLGAAEMRSPADGNCVAENSLCFTEPCWAEGSRVHLQCRRMDQAEQPQTKHRVLVQILSGVSGLECCYQFLDGLIIKAGRGVFRPDVGRDA